MMTEIEDPPAGGALPEEGAAAPAANGCSRNLQHPRDDVIDVGEIALIEAVLKRRTGVPSRIARANSIGVMSGRPRGRRR